MDTSSPAGIDREMALLEEALLTATQSRLRFLSLVSQQVIGCGGKRIRPRVLLLSFHAAGGTEAARALPLAVAVELLHTASLVHDDINDQSALRRGQATVNDRWGNNLALLAGDYIFCRLLQLLPTCAPQAIAILADACVVLVEGETRQALSAWDVGLTEDEYLSIVGDKTAALFGACAQLGGLAAEAAPAQLDALHTYGYNLGMAFQIRDDTLDLIGQSEMLGKPTANDLGQGKVGLPLILALARSSAALALWQAQDWDRLRCLLVREGVIEEAVARAQSYAQQANAVLLSLPESPTRAALKALATFAAQRER